MRNLPGGGWSGYREEDSPVNNIFNDILTTDARTNFLHQPSTWAESQKKQLFGSDNMIQTSSQLCFLFQCSM